jgi:hypothetical protein
MHASRAVDGRVPIETVGGKGFAPGDSPAWDGMRFGPGGRALLGTAVVSCTFPVDMLSDNSAYAATSTSIDSEEGDCDIDIHVVGGVDRLRMGTTGAASLYVVSSAYTISSAKTTAGVDLADSVVTSALLSGGAILWTSQVFLGSAGPIFVNSAVVEKRDGLTTDGPPTLWFKATNATTNKYSVADVSFAIARFRVFS